MGNAAPGWGIWVVLVLVRGWGESNSCLRYSLVFASNIDGFYACEIGRRNVFGDFLGVGDADISPLPQSVMELSTWTLAI